MKTILIPTDFSANATHAAEYGYQLARQIKGNIILCNAFVIPVEMPQAGMVVWPMEEYDDIVKSCADDLKALKRHLEKTGPHGFQPSIECVSEAGAMQDVITEIAGKSEIGLIIMGTHGASGLSSFIMGNHSRRMIDYTAKPLLLIPSKAKGFTVKKIAFATDLDNISEDLTAIFELVIYAKALNAEILLTYVDDEKYHTEEFRKHMDRLLTYLSNKANYPLIYYRLIKNKNIESGLDWLCGHSHVDMLAMVHRPHNFLDALLKGSHTQKMAGHVSVPLLVFPAKS